MLVLGIESSCDETSAAVLRDDLVLSDVVQSQALTHAEYGGVIPELASRDHLRNIEPVVREALLRASVHIGELDGIAVTCRPGLVGALLVGVQVAKGMAWAKDKPLVGVDHLVGHILAPFLRRDSSVPSVPLPFPFVALLVSGGHTGIYRVDGPLAEQMSELGGTRDDAAGEAFDKVAKLLGLGYPGGPIVDQLASQAEGPRPEFRIPMPSAKTAEMSFSGIKTQISALVASREGKAPLTSAEVACVCSAFQEGVTRVLVEKTVAAAKREGVSSIVLGGGVAANRQLRARMVERGTQASMRVYLPTPESCTDNGAMIAFAGSLMFKAGRSSGWDLAVTSETSLVRVTRKGRGNRV